MRNDGGGILPQPSNNIENTLSLNSEHEHPNPFRAKLQPRKEATRIGFIMCQHCCSDGPDTEPNMTYVQHWKPQRRIHNSLWVASSLRSKYKTLLAGALQRRLPAPVHPIIFFQINVFFSLKISLSLPVAALVPRRHGFPRYKAVVYLREMSREVKRTSP